MDNQNKNKIIIALLVVIIVILSVLCILFATGTIGFKSNNVDNNKLNDNVTDNNNDNNEINNTNSLSSICTAEVYDKLQILSMENKTEQLGAIGSSIRGYNVTTTVTKDHNYTSIPENEEFYANDYLGNLFVLYKNKLYYTSQKDTISKYCETINSSKKLTCNYSKFNDNTIKEFNIISIDVNLKAIGSYGNAGSGRSEPYAITTDGKVISITEDASHNYNGCGIMYDNSEYPIDRIFNMYFYDGIEYTILLKDGTLITRDVDREHPIELEH